MYAWVHRQGDASRLGRRYGRRVAPEEEPGVGPLDLDGAVAVVTGAASGIGTALAEQLHSRGARLVLADVAQGPLEEVAGRLGAEALVVDVSKPTDVDRLAAVAPEARLVCLNAGVTSSQPGPVWEAAAEEWRRVLDVNLYGVVNGLRSFIPQMLTSGRPSHILITASLAGLATWPGGGPYAASKHAVVAVAEQAALSLADTPIGLSVLCPALVRSGMSPVGEDPTTVAAEALAMIAAARFLSVPAEWQEAVHDRGDRLARGLPPVIPQPRSS